MFDRIRARLRWFRRDVYYTVHQGVRSRSTLVVVGNAGGLLSALAWSVYLWTHPVSLVSYAVIQVACLALQAVALIPLVWPGPEAAPRNVREFHQEWTVSIACLPLVLAICPGLIVLAALDLDADSPLLAAVLLPYVALTLACMAGMLTESSIPSKVAARHRESAALPGGPDWEVSGAGADVDSGGFDRESTAAATTGPHRDQDRGGQRNPARHARDVPCALALINPLWR